MATGEGEFVAERRILLEQGEADSHDGGSLVLLLSMEGIACDAREAWDQPGIDPLPDASGIVRVGEHLVGELPYQLHHRGRVALLRHGLPAGIRHAQESETSHISGCLEHGMLEDTGLLQQSAEALARVDREAGAAHLLADNTTLDYASRILQAMQARRARKPVRPLT
ncbi:hypothetical protein EDD95_5029 [Streptomyces sp. CEV 2-1]|nr:hypothetical protein EDD95_5029 [Streptomyces sp. CEV 2-1]